MRKRDQCEISAKTTRPVNHQYNTTHSLLTYVLNYAILKNGNVPRQEFPELWVLLNNFQDICPANQFLLGEHFNQPLQDGLGFQALVSSRQGQQLQTILAKRGQQQEQHALQEDPVGIHAHKAQNGTASLGALQEPFQVQIQFDGQFREFEFQFLSGERDGTDTATMDTATK